MTLTNQTATVRTARQVTGTTVRHGARGSYCDSNGMNMGLAEVGPEDYPSFTLTNSGNTAISDSGTDITGEDRPTAPLKNALAS